MRRIFPPNRFVFLQVVKITEIVFFSRYKFVRMFVILFLLFKAMVVWKKRGLIIAEHYNSITLYFWRENIIVQKMKKKNSFYIAPDP